MADESLSTPALGDAAGSASAVAPLDYAGVVPAPAPNEDAREVMGCLFAWFIFVAGLSAALGWLYWSSINTL